MRERVQPPREDAEQKLARPIPCQTDTSIWCTATSAAASTCREHSHKHMPRAY